MKTGSVQQHRLSERSHECNVVLVGDCRVGKSALVNRFINNKFTEFYRATQFEKFTTSAMVSGRRVKYTIWDTAGSHSSNSARDLAFREADAYLLCFRITDPSTLFSALNHWFPELRSRNPDAPVVLVGCGSDQRADRDLVAAMSKQGRAPVSTDQALSFGHRIGAATYVETSAKSPSAVISAFELAVLASGSGKTSSNHKRSASYSYYPRHTGTTGSTGSSSNTSTSPQDSLERNGDNSSSHVRQLSTTPQDPLGRNGDNSPSHVRQLSTTSSSTNKPSFCLPRSTSVPKASTLHGSSKTRSSSSIPCITSKTPKPRRKLQPLQEKMVTIRCQRLTADKTYEEIEVDVPAPIYETIQLYNDAPGGSDIAGRNKERRKSFGTKLKSFFVKN